MPGEGLPSGRERAIETLIDSEPNGAAYRAARILDEVVPQALLNRPNLMTRSALVEQAHALSEYEVDSYEKFTEAFGVIASESSGSSSSCDDVDDSEECTDRVLKHHSKIVTFKAQNKAATPPSQLMATLKRLYGSNLMKSALDHNAFSEEEEPEDMIANLESIVGNVCRDVVDEEEDALQGLLLATLSVLTGSVLDQMEEVEPDLTKGKSVATVPSIAAPPRQDPNDMPALQVGALMSLLEAGSEKGPYSLDDKILKYLGDAAAVHEERIEIQKSRLLARMEEEERKADDEIPVVPITPNVAIVEDDDDDEDEEGDDDDHGITANIVEDDDDDEEEAEEDDDDDDDDEDEDNDDDDDDDGLDLPGGANTLSSSVFDQIISAVAGDDMSLDGVDRAALRLEAGGLGADSSDSDDDSDNDSDHMDRYDAPHAEPDDDDDEEDEDEESSSEEEQDDDDDDEPEEDDPNPDDDEDDDEDDDDDDDDDDDIAPDSILRQALALSLAEHNTGIMDEDDDEDGPEDEEEEERGFATPRRVSETSSRSTKSDVNDGDPAAEPPLPELPTPPAHYPYWSSVDTVADVDDRKDRGDNLNPCLDPNSLTRFGSIPASYAIVRLLQNSLSTVAKQSIGEQKKPTKKESNEQAFKVNPIPGGMGAALFGSEARLYSSSDNKDRGSDDEDGRSLISIQLLVASLLVFFDNRKDAIEGLRLAVLAEQRNAQGDGDEDDGDNGDGNDTPLSDEEEEDNTVALAMTLNYHENRDSSRSSPSHAESLESKGMTRKAAAAGFDAAMRIKSLKKKTDAWKDRVKFYSYCTLLAMKCLRTYVQSCVAERLDARLSVDESSGSFLTSLEKVVPRDVSSKLSATIASMLSVGEFRALATLVSGDEAGEVDELFMPLPLYREALVTWGECIPLFYPTPADREQVLRDLITGCFSNSRSLHHFRAFDTLLTMPSTEDESQLYKLDILCRRFCVTDLLDDVVSRPLCFNPESVKAGSEDSGESPESPTVASSLVRLLYSSALKTNGACLRFLRRFNMALCHRCNVRGILWDGLYACSQLETDDAAIAAVSTSSSETVRVSSNPSSSLLFDSTKCSDSIAILSNHADSPAALNGSSAHQRASKVWGTVISSAYFNPKSGVHRWAVRLDRCERGHVFVGVSTTQASMRTYVGGDKYGWGVIGTQALWHDRRKIRGDYGATFRTGSVIVVTLDTDAGTLSFSSWKDTNSSSGSFSLDPLFPGLTSPRRQASGGGTLEDWGVAFEGLPLDAKLYPAVGLYQRDDRVTLLSVESGGRSGGQNATIDGELFAGGAGYYPRLSKPLLSKREDFVSQMTKIRSHNDTLSWDSIDFVESMLSNVADSIQSEDVNHRNLGLHTILPSVASAVCLLPPSIPVLSERFALHLLPKITDCINGLNALVEEQQRSFPSVLKEGKWVIRATGSSGSSSSNEFEEYVVNFSNKVGSNGECAGFLGNGIGTTGKSKNGLVSIIGTVYGSSVHFVEEWTDGVDEASQSDEASSSCVISARLSLDGFKLEGSYRNVQYGTTGHIAAVCLADGDTPTPEERSSTKNDALRCQALLRLAHGHLATILGNDTAGDHTLNGEIEEQKIRLRKLLSSSPFCEGLRDASNDIGEKALVSLRETYSGGKRVAGLLDSDLVKPQDNKTEEIDSSSIIVDVSNRDKELSERNGGSGSLCSLSPAVYTEARLQVLSVLVHHSCPNQKLDLIPDEKINGVWRAALKIMEDQVRGALSDSSLSAVGTKARSSERCQQIIRVSKFLLSLQPNTEQPIDSMEVFRCLALCYEEVRSEDDIKAFREEFDASMRRACLKLIALNQLLEVLPQAGTTTNVARLSAVECTSIAIPRLLGRGSNKSLASPSSDSNGAIEIGNHYLSGLRGAGHTLRKSIRTSVHGIITNLGQVLKQASDLPMSAHNDSLILSVLPIFACSLRPGDIENVVVRSEVLGSLSRLLSRHRAALQTKRSEPPKIETNKSLLVGEMREIVARDVARGVMQTSVSVFHTITYQMIQWTRLIDADADDRSAFSALDSCVSLLLGEFNEVVPFLEKLLRKDLDSYLTKQGEVDFARWVSTTNPDGGETEKSKRKKSQAKSSRSGLYQLLESGTLIAVPSQSPATPSKSGSKSSSATTSQVSGGSHADFIHTSGIACHQHLSRCLDILNSIVRSPEARTAVVDVDNWMEVFLAAIGVSIQRGQGGVIEGCATKPKESRVPARYRGRILRFLSSVLVHTSANDVVAEGLFTLAGEANDVTVNTLHGDESLVAGDVIACLRAMYSHSSPEWRECIDRVIAKHADGDANPKSAKNISVGVLAFVAGSIRTLGPGSHVLLKPAAAAPLSPDSQSTPSSSKSSSGSGTSGSSGGVTSHHVVGTGSEGIVAGLCRVEAAAGVVSSVDTKTGMCEVILVERDGEKSAPLPHQRPRSTLTVRALRSPLAEVAQAEQVALSFEPTFPVVELLKNTLPFALSLFENPPESSGVDGNAQIRAHILPLHVALLALRAAIVLLSDERLLDTFCKYSGCKELFSTLLSLAGKEKGFKSKVVEAVKLESLASLPIHEGKYHRFCRMLAELQVRRSVLDVTSDSTWNKRGEALRARGKRKPAEVNERKERSTTEQATSNADGMDASSSFAPSSSTRRDVTSSRRQTSQSSVSSNSTEDEEESEAAATAAAHLREAAIAQMAELGLPRSWSELALRRTGGTNIEAAVHFCLERGGDMERLLAEERERERMMQRSSTGSSRRRGTRDDSARSSHLLRQLLEMGFPSRWCAEALAATRNNVDEALTWILTNGERLSAEDEGMEDEDDDADEDFDDEDDEDDDDEEDGEGDDSEQVEEDGDNQASTGDGAQSGGQAGATAQADADSSPNAETESPPLEEEVPKGWCGSVTPLRFISGRSIINPKTLSVSGLPTGGFSSVGTKGILLTTGKWYYEAILETAGCLQIGWADDSFSGHCHAERGDGCGDGPSSWAYDGWRRYRWHASATEWGCRWKEGDVIGCLVDMDEKIVSFTVNGKGEEVGMGVAFSGQGFRPCGGVYACVSFNRKEKLRMILGGKGTEPFKFEPPVGYRGVGEAVVEAVHDREKLLEKENILSGENPAEETERRFLCDFSDGEHGHELFAWQHRYYGSDASVHLGSGRSSKQSSGSSKSGSSSGAQVDSSPLACVGLRAEKAWSCSEATESESTTDALDAAKKQIAEGFQSVACELVQDVTQEGLLLGIFYSRKLMLHLIVTFGRNFDLGAFGNDGDLDAARSFWRVIDSCVSLRSAGWVGEAGAMAIAAEALGLGISSTEHQSKSQACDRPGLSSIPCGDENLPLPVAGISQLLSTISFSKPNADSAGRETWRSLAACAEASIGADGGGGPLVFLQQGLQSALCQSTALQDVLVAIIRRSVRLLAVVDYSGDDSSSSDNPEDDEMDSSSSAAKPAEDAKDSDETTKAQHPDARLTCFLTGLLLSAPVQSSIPDKQKLYEDLLEAWSVGLLSASAPWRMVCALTASGILNTCPAALKKVVQSLPTVLNFYKRLQNTVLRRVWAERAAVPVCSRYVQALIELLASVRRADLASPAFTWNKLQVDASTPLPLDTRPLNNNMIADGISPSWEWDEGWVSNDAGWEVWVGNVECAVIDWKTPSRSAVRTLMDGGEGPPMLREGCTVVRGPDWDDDASGVKTGNDDGKKEYEAEKAEREKEKKLLEEQAADDPAEPEAGDSNDEQPDPESADEVDGSASATAGGKDKKDSSKKKKRKKIPNPKLPTGTILSVEAWNGIPAMARRVRWHLTGEEGIYRYGGHGGRFDICHVEVNDKGTRIRKRHPLPESAEQCAARHGFGAGKKHSVLLRLRRLGEKQIDGSEYHHQGVLEWPDFGAGVRVSCTQYEDGAVLVKEHELLFGSKDSGWEARFGQPSFTPGTEIMLTPTGSSKLKDIAELNTKSSFMSMYQELLGSTSYVVDSLRHRGDGSKVRVTLEMTLLRGRRSDKVVLPKSLKYSARPPPPMCFDRDYHASSMSLSHDGRTLTCVSPEGRGSAFASVGFTKGVHYWEVKLEQADIGSVFIGVAEKPSGSGSSSGSSFGDSPPRLNRWLGWGFVNFRATYTAGAERVYGAHCHSDDTVGVLLDCDAGRVSFFYDGLKYGEHILNDLGCAFENISPFGFNADGCGSGGAGQGAPSGIEGGRGGRYPAHGVVRPKALWPVIGLRNPGDRVTISTKWSTSFGSDGAGALKNVLACDELIASYCSTETHEPEMRSQFPEWFVKEAFDEYKRWHSRRWYKTTTRGTGPHRLATVGLDVDLDRSPLACAAACASIGLRRALLAGDRVKVKRSAGRPLELAEEAVVLGAHQCRLYYRLVAQKSEGGSLTEGGGRAWFWDESEVVGESLELVGQGKGGSVTLPLIDRFKCLSTGGIRIVYEGGAVVRSDLEIFDGSSNLGSIPHDTVIPRNDVLERRVNSCGVIRFRIRFPAVGEGWISSRIRGGKEESIVEPLHDSTAEEEPSLATPEEAAIVWQEQIVKVSPGVLEIEQPLASFEIADLGEFKKLVTDGLLPGKPPLHSDSIVATLVSTIADFSEEGDAVECSFSSVSSAVSYAIASCKGQKTPEDSGSAIACEAAATVLAAAQGQFDSSKALMARISVLRAINRRLRKALPWLPVRPSQEGTAILGGLCGQGASVERAGRSKLTESMQLWVQVPCIASRVRSLRGLFFSSVKLEFLESVTLSTTTPTPLSHDEYELPREIRTVRVNRLKARRAMAGKDGRLKRKHSVFSQLQNETRSWGGAALRRGFVAKGHGGQKRAFKVKLIGEGVNDYSGPYREVFTDAVHEVLEFETSGRGSLGVLDPTPNNASEIGDDRELFMFSRGEKADVQGKLEEGISAEELRIRRSFSSLTMARDESSREVEESLVFLGRLVGTACRHGIPVDLPLPMSAVWKSVAEGKSDPQESLREIDLLASKLAGEGGLLLAWQQRMLNSFVDGMSNLLPVELLPLLSGEELRDMLCGNPDVDVDLLKRVVEYEGYSEEDSVVDYFWEALREMSNDDRKRFLQFVWARTRLPNKESDFEAPFKIQKDSSGTDDSLPSASTCFFSLTLPEYTSKEILRKKLTFAIENVCTMESDYVTNDSEVGEGWRGI